MKYYVHVLLGDMDDGSVKASLTAAMKDHVLVSSEAPGAWLWDSMATTEPSGSYCMHHNPFTKTPVLRDCTNGWCRLSNGGFHSKVP